LKQREQAKGKNQRQRQECRINSGEKIKEQKENEKNLHCDDERNFLVPVGDEYFHSEQDRSTNEKRNESDKAES
jgi:hypothetical protein